MTTRGERLKQALARRGVGKQVALAHELRVHQSTITRWKEDGPISLANAVEVCVLLDVSLDWLLLGRGSMDHHKAADLDEGMTSESDAMLRRWSRAQAELSSDVLERILDLTDTLVERNRLAGLR